jgi:hypothetical protein
VDKRLLKRHKRQVARAKEHVKLSEPDMRTPEQIKAAREAARTATGRGTGSSAHYSSPSVQNRGPSTASTAKGDS